MRSRSTHEDRPVGIAVGRRARSEEKRAGSPVWLAGGISLLLLFASSASGQMENRITTDPTLDHAAFAWDPDGVTVYSLTFAEDADSALTRLCLAATPAGGGPSTILRGASDNATYHGLSVRGVPGQPDIIAYTTDHGGGQPVVSWIASNDPQSEHVLSTAGVNSASRFGPPMGNRLVNLRSAPGDSLRRVIVTTWPGGTETAWTGPGLYFDPQWCHGSNCIICVKSDPETGYEQLYELDGPAQEVRLTNAAWDHYLPEVSPDGSKVAYVRIQTGDDAPFPEVAIRDLLTGQETVVPGGGVPATFPRWSPDGQYVVFERSAPDSIEEPIVYRVSDGIECIPGYLLPRRARVMPQFDPSGTKLAYLSNTGGAPDTWQIWTMPFVFDAQTRVEGPGPTSPRSPGLRLTPDPFTHDLAIDLRLAAGPARVSIFDPSGRLVRLLYSGTVKEGPMHLTWNGIAGRLPAPRGMYLVRAESGAGTSQAKAFLLR